MLIRIGDSLLAALVAWAAPFTYLVFSGPTFDTAGRPDNAPYWAKGALILLTPLILGVLATYYFLVPLVLSSFEFRSFQARATTDVLTATTLALAFYLEDFSTAGWAGIQALGLVWVILLFILITGELARWVRQLFIAA